MRDKERLLIKKVAEQLNISPRTIRFYESKGLISPHKQENNAYRTFTEKDIWRLQTIVSLREAGMSIEEIKQVLPVFEEEDREQLQAYLELQRSVLYTHWLETRHIISTTESIIELVKRYDTVPLKHIFELAQASRSRREARKSWSDHWDFDRQAGTHDEIVQQDHWKYRDYEQALNTTVEWVAPAAGERGLDIGTGTGNLAGKMLGRGITMAAIDQSLEMLKQCERKYPELETRAGNFLAIPYIDKQFDFIVSSFAFHHISDEQKRIALEEMIRVLKKHGRICMTDVMFKDRQHREKWFMEHQRLDNREEAGLENEHYADLSMLLQWFDELGYITKVRTINDRLFTLLAVPIR